MNDWYQRMLPVLQLNGKGEPTQKAYSRMARMSSEFYGKTPDLISEPELQRANFDISRILEMSKYPPRGLLDMSP
jgi:hypothetical protein